MMGGLWAMGKREGLTTSLGVVQRTLAESCFQKRSCGEPARNGSASLTCRIPLGPKGSEMGGPGKKKRHSTLAKVLPEQYLHQRLTGKNVFGGKIRRHQPVWRKRGQERSELFPTTVCDRRGTSRGGKTKVQGLPVGGTS